MPYPIKLVDINNGFSLYIPDPVLLKSAYENLLAKDKTTAFPFWAKIWPSSKAIASFLINEPHFIESKCVLEIGAGIGLPSLMLAHLALEVVISDHAPESVFLIKKNIQHIGAHNVKAICLDWNDFPENINADLVLLSDINYDPIQFDSLFTMIQKFIKKGSTIIISTPQRITATPFAEALRPFIKQTFFQSVEDGQKFVDIHILILSM